MSQVKTTKAETQSFVTGLEQKTLTPIRGITIFWGRVNFSVFKIFSIKFLQRTKLKNSDSHEKEIKTSTYESKIFTIKISRNCCCVNCFAHLRTIDNAFFQFFNAN